MSRLLFPLRHAAVCVAALAVVPPATAAAAAFPVNPTGTYLRAFRDPTAPVRLFTGVEPATDPATGRFGFTGVDLAALGVSPGDRLTLTTAGGTRYAASDPDPSGGLVAVTAVFSTTDEQLGRRNPARLPGAVAAPGLPGFVTGPTLRDDLPTDIPEDFLLSAGVAASVVVPDRARFLFVAVVDRFLSDNLPGSPPATLTLTGPTVRSVPEPVTGALVLLGLAIASRRDRPGVPRA